MTERIWWSGPARDWGEKEVVSSRLEKSLQRKFRRKVQKSYRAWLRLLGKPFNSDPDYQQSALNIAIDRNKRILKRLKPAD